MKARPEAVDGAFMLFPTVCDMAQTPNGRRLRPLFFFVSAYILAAVVAVFFVYLFPAPLTLRLCEALFPIFPRSQLYVLRSLICSPRTVFSALRMARDEMRIIKGIQDLPSYDDPPLEEGEEIRTSGGGTKGEKEESWGMGEGGAVADVLRTNAKGIWVYFAERDNWVGEKGRVEIYRALKEGGGAFDEGMGNGSGEAVFGSDGVPHDFCISEYWVCSVDGLA
ncbi:hypothetical protein BS47DRAFT_239743 [Hydnum rufescens UP504]|uniref:Uncharacterized protein n=1 Tax=Hydnum rufescens UP504 TaxID=1448309 RepID=A0A9P6ALY3_9AGAM|nr:hypothetical protein BS47DRAFT_239743 [Hydnum rufescens UP504]